MRIFMSVGATILLLTPSTVCAAVVLENDFDGGGSEIDFSFSSGFAGGGGENASPPDFTLSSSLSAPGSPGNAGSATGRLVDTFQPGNPDGFVAVKFGVGLNLDGSTELTSSNLSDYTFTFDARTSPDFVTDPSDNFASIAFRRFDSTPGVETTIDSIVVEQNDLVFSDEFQTFSFNLGDANVVDGSQSDFDLFFADVFQATIEFGADGELGGFPRNTDNSLSVDNLSLSVTAVPEPTTAGLLTLGLGCIFARRRSKKS